MATNGHAVHPPQDPPPAPAAPAAPAAPGLGTYEEYNRDYSIWHKDQYLFPVDEKEMDRMDAMHKFFLVARKYRLCSAHIIDFEDRAAGPQNPQILDLGTGTGIWALDVAKQLWDPVEHRWRAGHIQAVDKCLVMQPPDIYANTTFSFVDVEDQWTAVRPHSKHLIHARMLAGSITSWPILYQKACQHLLPGGWLEHIEIDWDFANDNGPVSPYLRKWADELLDATDRSRRPLRLDRNRTIESLNYGGLVNIKEEVLHIRVNGGSRNAWEIDAGRWFNLGLHKGFMGMSLGPLCQIKKWPVADVKALEGEVLREIGHRDNTSYCRLYIWSAQRPAVQTPQSEHR